MQIMATFEKKNHTIGLIIALLIIYPKEILYLHKYVCTKLLIVKVFKILKNWKLAKCPIIREWSIKYAT